MTEYGEDGNYSDEVVNAVRYGYLFRKEAEKAEQNDSISVHHCLPRASYVLLWLGQKIIDGLVFDAFKTVALKLYEHLTQKGAPLDRVANCLLLDDRELELFYNYVREFNKQSAVLTAKQFQYIREEIKADYYGKEVAKIMDNEKRLPTHEEYIRFFNEAAAHADELLKPIESE